MKITVEFLPPLKRRSDVFDVSRVPCVGELITIIDEEKAYEVHMVFHVLNADPETQVQAIIRVRA